MKGNDIWRLSQTPGLKPDAKIVNFETHEQTNKINDPVSKILQQ